MIDERTSPSGAGEAARLGDILQQVGWYVATFVTGDVVGQATLSWLVSPWPTKFWSAITGVFALVSFLGAFVFLRRRPTSDRRTGLMKFAAMFFILSSFVYGFVAAYFLVPNPTWDSRDVIGYQIRPELEEFIMQSPRYGSVEELLKGSHRKVEAIWTHESIANMKAVLGAFWLLMVLSLSALLVSFADHLVGKNGFDSTDTAHH